MLSPAAPPLHTRTQRNLSAVFPRHFCPCPRSPAAGNRMYAGCIARLLDPGGAFFGDRSIAQGADRAEEMVPDQAKSLMQVSDRAA